MAFILPMSEAIVSERSYWRALFALVIATNSLRVLLQAPVLI